MTKPHFQHVTELMKAAQTTGIKLQLLDRDQAEAYINNILKKFNPCKVTGHLSIGDHTNKLPTDEFEFKFSFLMKPEPAYIFFEQDTFNRLTVARIDDAQKISPLMENSYGMEYFVSDEIGSFLVAVNWYSIEYTGNALSKKF